MKHNFRIFSFTLLMSLLSMVSLGCGWAFAASPSEPIHTPHFQLAPVSASSSPSIKIAGIYWLPDYLKDNLNRDNGDSEPPQPTPPPSGECETYKLTTPSNVDTSRYQCDTVFVHETLTCYNNCRCKPTRNPGSGEHCILWCENNCIDTACNAPVALTYPNDRCTERCAQNNSICTDKTCDSYCSGNASRYCSGAYTGSDGCGSSCYQCCSDTCSTGATSSYCPSNQISYANGSKTECGNTCYSCRDKTCADGGYKSSTGGMVCTSVSYAGKTCYKDCVCDNSCSSGSTSSSCGTNEIAYSVGSTKCGNTCYSCRAKTCDDGGYKSSTGGMVCTSVSYAGKTCYKDCQCDDSCNTGSKSACSASQVQTSTSKTACGSTCYVCRNKTCAEKGQKDCNGSCIATTACCGGCPSGQTCNNGSCVKACSLPTCSGITTKPANSSYTTTSCTDCSGTKTINNGWTCNSGYTKSGNSCVKPVCVPDTSCPACPECAYTSATYRHVSYQKPDGCGGYVTCERVKSCEEACPVRPSNCQCTDAWGNQSSYCSEENYERCRTTCLEHCNNYPNDECWWEGCSY